MIERSLRMGRMRVGLALFVALLLLALVGPLFAPTSPNELIGIPFGPSPHSMFGTDYLGRDVLSRFLWGGRSVFLLATLATSLGVGLGIAVGLIAAYARGRLDDLLMRAMDVILCFPQIVLTLVAAATVGPSLTLLVITIAFTTMPRTARVVRGSALEIVERDFVRATQAIGESRVRILLGEILPNILGPLLVEVSLRYTYTIGLIAGLSFLGFGLQPPAADWGLMINENRLGIQQAPWAVALPVLAIAHPDDRDRPGRRRTGALGLGCRPRARNDERPPSGEFAVVVEDLRIDVSATGVDVVDEVSFRIRPGEVLGLVGESGSGKTTVGLALLGHTRRGVRVAHGRISVAGHEILSLPPEQRRVLRGAVVSYVPQDPGSALNPEPAHRQADLRGAGLPRHRRRRREPTPTGRRVPRRGGAALDRRVPAPLPPPALRRPAAARRPRDGLRVPSTRARARRADHGTRRDDAGARARHRARSLRPHGVAALYVSHDLAVISDLADRVALMYSGRLVEVGPKVSFFQGSAHPYARRLIEAIPEMSGDHELLGIPGSAPRPGQRPDGCFFAPRCNWVDDVCRTAFPPRVVLEDDHEVRCYRYQEVLAAARAERISARERAEIAELPTALLSVRNLSASYGLLQVLHDINLAVEPGECVALVGESGSGKTTLARCIGGLHRDLDGEILLNGAAPRTGREGTQSRGAPADPVRLPEPVRVAEPPQDDRPVDRPAADGSSSTSAASVPTSASSMPSSASRWARR